MPQEQLTQGSMMAAPAPAAAPAAPAATTTTTKKHHHMAGHALPAAKFSSVATAQAHCPGDAVVYG